jgi:hypothetical protein
VKERAGFEPATCSIEWSCSFRSNCILTASKSDSGEKQTRVNPETSVPALARTFDDSSPLEPFRCAAFAARQRSFSHPFLPKETGISWWRSNLIFTARKRIPGENRPRYLRALPLSYLPVKWRGSDSNRQPRRFQRSNPGLTAWKIGRRDRICTCMGFRPRVSETRVYPLHHSPDKIGGLEQELHLRPSPYGGAALTAAPSSQDGGDRGSCSLTIAG